MYSNAKYVKDMAGNVSSIRVDISGAVSFVPIAPANSDYSAIMALVESGDLVIAPAD